MVLWEEIDNGVFRILRYKRADGTFWDVLRPTQKGR
jgi:hypothetical protein